MVFKHKKDTVQYVTKEEKTAHFNPVSAISVI